MGADLSTLGVTGLAEDGPVSMTDEEYRARAIGKMDVEMRKKYGSKGEIGRAHVRTPVTS